ncbi:unnamed protein product, partial [Rotaria magnacalcarata]
LTMIGLNQAKKISGVLTPDIKEKPMECWSEQSTSNADFCNAIDEIMKHEHEGDILLDDNLSSEGQLDLDLDSISDLLDTPSPAQGATAAPISPSSTTDYPQSNNIYMTSTSRPTFPVNNNSKSNTSGYSSLGISPKFTTLSINQHHHPFSPPPSQDSNNASTLLQSFVQGPITINSKNSLHPPPYVQEQQHTSVLGTSYPLELQLNSGFSDVKRFRSSSMNEGATQQQQQTKIDRHLFDPSRIKLPAYINTTYYPSRASSSTNITTPTTTTTNSSTSSISTDVSSNTAWPFGDYTRPTSNSFSEVINQQQQLRLNNSLSSSYGGSPSFYSMPQQRNQTGFLPDINFQPQQPNNCTLYSLNQSGAGATSSPPPASALARKRSSLVGFPVPEIKDDPSSPNCTMEQQSETDLWSDIEQNSSDHMQDNDIDDDDEATSDDDNATTVSTTFNRDLESSKAAHSHPNSSSLFWQYNVQAKGPKTKRILYLKERDPHLYREFSDPVYQIKLTQTKGQTFTKLRKGDGNDVTPNPTKLYQLGKQIRDLSTFVNKTTANTPSVYHGIYHVDQPIHNSNDTAEVKKEKNKIASRACRLRKKAQHEANKLKLHGLNEEHKTLIDLIASVKLLVLKRYNDGQLASPLSSTSESLEAALDHLIVQKYNKPVAGNTDGFVQAVITDMERLYASKQQRSNSLNT